MCFVIPYKIYKIKGKKAQIKIGRNFKEINLNLISKTKVGDYILVQNNFAIKKISKKELKQIQQLINAQKI